MVEIIRNGAILVQEIAELRASVGWAYTPGTYERSLPTAFAYFTARDGTELVGFVCVISDGVGDAFLVDLMVRPSHQGQRIGSRLVHDALCFVRDSGVQCTQVTFDTRLTEFYRKAGFHIFGGGIIDYPRMEIPDIEPPAKGYNGEPRRKVSSPTPSAKGATEEVLGPVLDALKCFPETAAIALSGSCARGIEDLLSDVDFCILAEPEIPPAEVRREAYAQAGWTKFHYFNEGFEISLGESFNIGDQHVDLMWMQIPAVEKYLNKLSTDFECAEYLPGGLMLIRPQHDPGDIIGRLRKIVPEYSKERSMHRTGLYLRRANFSMAVLGGIDKGALRNDYFHFVKAELEVLDRLVAALFALNRRWFCHEKRLVEMIGEFELIPRDVVNRFRKILMHQEECAQLEACAREIKSIFADVVHLARGVYPEIDVPEACI